MTSSWRHQTKIEKKFKIWIEPSLRDTNSRFWDNTHTKQTWLAQFTFTISSRRGRVPPWGRRLRGRGKRWRKVFNGSLKKSTTQMGPLRNTNVSVCLLGHRNYSLITKLGITRILKKQSLCAWIFSQATAFKHKNTKTQKHKNTKRGGWNVTFFSHKKLKKKK